MLSNTLPHQQIGHSETLFRNRGRRRVLYLSEFVVRLGRSSSPSPMTLGVSLLMITKQVNKALQRSGVRTPNLDTPHPRLWSFPDASCLSKLPPGYSWLSSSLFLKVTGVQEIELKIHIYLDEVCHMLLSSYWENIDFSRKCPKFHIFTKNAIFKKYNWNS